MDCFHPIQCVRFIGPDKLCIKCGKRLPNAADFLKETKKVEFYVFANSVATSTVNASTFFDPYGEGPL